MNNEEYEESIETRMEHDKIVRLAHLRNSLNRLEAALSSFN